MGQCTATSKRTHERCKRFCAPGKTVCKWHGGNSKGAPKGNKNAFKHGAYESVSLQTMTEEEITYANSVSLDPVFTLREQLKILHVKEARIAIRMKKALDNERLVGQEDETGKKIAAMVVLSGSQVVAENYQGDRSKTVSTSSETHEMHYLRFEQAHSLILDQIRRVAEALAKAEAQLGGEESAVPKAIEVTIIDGRREGTEGTDEDTSSDAE